MNKIVSTVVLVLTICISLGCAAPRKKLATPSGNSEIVINGATKKQLIDLLISSKLGTGFRIKTANDYSVVIVKNIDDFSAMMAYGSKYNRTPEARITYSFVDVNVGEGVKIFVQSEMVTNPNSQYESTTDFTSTWGESAQKELIRIKAMVENK